LKEYYRSKTVQTRKPGLLDPGFLGCYRILARWGLFGVFIRAELLVARIACFANGFDLDANVGVVTSLGRGG
jgi:hypothetical protein